VVDVEHVIAIVATQSSRPRGADDRYWANAIVRSGADRLGSAHPFVAEAVAPGSCGLR
jgi:hypothetical protein